MHYDRFIHNLIYLLCPLPNWKILIKKWKTLCEHAFCIDFVVFFDKYRLINLGIYASYALLSLFENSSNLVCLYFTEIKQELEFNNLHSSFIICLPILISDSNSAHWSLHIVANVIEYNAQWIDLWKAINHILIYIQPYLLLIYFLFHPNLGIRHDYKKFSNLSLFSSNRLE